MAASQNIARLGIVLGMDSGELVTKIEEAQAKFGKFKAQIKRDSEDAAKEIVRLESATRNYGKTLTEVEKIEEQIRLGKYKNQPDLIVNKLKEQAAAYDKVAASAKAAEQAKMGKAGGMTAQQQAALGYQTTDIITSLAGGQNPMMVLLQQGGQLRDQFGGFKPLFQGIASAVTPAMIAFTSLAASVGVLGLAFMKGEEESNKFRNSMILTGNFAGIAVDKFNLLATTISGKYNSAIGDSREIMQALVSSGQFTEKTLTSVGSLITKVASLSGEAAADVAKSLIPSLDGSASSAKKLNDQYHFLTLEQYKNIEALNRQGQAQEAIKVTSDALLEKLDSQAKKLGYLETLWKNLKNAASGFWDWLKSIGRDDPTKAIKDLEDQMERTMEGVAYRNGNTKLYDALKAKRDRIKAELDAETAKVEADSKAAEKNKDKIDAYSAAGGASKAISIAQKTAEIIAQMEYETKAAGLEKIAQIDLAKTRDIEIAKNEIAKRNADERFAMASANADELAARIKQIEAKANKEKEDLYKESRNKFRDLAQTEQDSIDKERERLQVYKENILSSQQDLDIALSRLKTQQELVTLNKQENMKDADREAAAARIQYLDKQREAVIMQREELKRLQDMNQSVFNNMGNAIDNFVRTGKLSFKDLTRSIIQDLISIAMKAQMMSMFKGFSFFGSSGGGSTVGVPVSPSMISAPTFAANGASADAGQPFYVGEQGPELFVPQGAGTIMPNKMVGAMTNNQPQVVYNGPYIANMSAIDTQSATQFLAKNKSTIWAVNQSAQRSLPVSK
jgi:phage-related minor tail protein